MIDVGGDAVFELFRCLESWEVLGCGMLRVVPEGKQTVVQEYRGLLSLAV
jgi:hypothetical protein